jgi:hypothetical protein
MFSCMSHSRVRLEPSVTAAADCTTSLQTEQDADGKKQTLSKPDRSRCAKQNTTTTNRKKETATEDTNSKRHNTNVYYGITLSQKKNEEQNIDQNNSGFAFRIKLGEYEVEIKGTREEVTKTIQSLPDLVVNIQKAFEVAKPKTVATLTVKTEPPAVTARAAPKASVQTYPKVKSAANCEDAVLRLLETDWGKWRPRTMEELKDAMKANDIKYTKRGLAGTLDTLAKKGMVRRWSTNTGFVYILAEKNPSSSRGETA